jgi:hypothetical protein
MFHRMLASNNTDFAVAYFFKMLHASSKCCVLLQMSQYINCDLRNYNNHVSIASYLECHYRLAHSLEKWSHNAKKREILKQKYEAMYSGKIGGNKITHVKIYGRISHRYMGKIKGDMYEICYYIFFF